MWSAVLSVSRGRRRAGRASPRGRSAEIVTEPAQQPWGYTGTFADPDGHLWMVTAEPV